MSPDAYKTALLVTARVTAGLAIAGCGGTVATPSEPAPAPSPEPATTAPPRASQPEPAQTRVPLACDPPQAECCNAIFDAIEKDWSQYSKVDHNVLWNCCRQEDPKFTRAACTPWGPPMPPSMLEVA